MLRETVALFRATDFTTMSAGVFISYRRDHGSTLARLLKEALERSGFDAFLDVDDLGSGHFDRKLLREIESRENFVLVCTEGCLTSCHDEADFLRLEIAHALKTSRNIVPVVVDGFSWPVSAELPEEIRDLHRHNDIAYSHRHWDGAKRELLRQMRRQRTAFRITIETDPSRFPACEEALAQLFASRRWTAGLKHPVEIRLLEPRATSVTPQLGLIESLRAANLLLVDVASPAREQMLYRAGIAIGLGIEFTTVSSAPWGDPLPPRPEGFPPRSAPSLAKDAPQHALEHLSRELARLIRQHFE